MYVLTLILGKGFLNYRLKREDLDSNTDALNLNLLSAVENGFDAEVLALLQNGASTEVLNSSGLTPLIVATMKDHNEIIKILLDHGANTMFRDSRGIFK